MNKKIVVILVITLLITTAYSSFGLEENISSIFNNSIEVEDQYNLKSVYALYYLFAGEITAQGFSPAHSPLTKVSLMITPYGNPPENTNLTVSIRETYDGDDIVSNTINLDDVTTTCIDLVFPDTDLTIGMMYYIICSTDKMGTNNDGWWWGVELFDPYERGDSWEYLHNLGYWREIIHNGEPVDFHFKTYWRDYAPDSCEIEGPIDGKAQEFTDYTFCTNDPEGDDVEYYIEWGDGLSFKWIGPYESGEIVTKGHSWASIGNYTIRVKARDIYGAECSDWAELEVNMPKIKTTKSYFLTFLQNYLHLFPLIRQILGLKT
jgi:hypothetical protein